MTMAQYGHRRGRPGASGWLADATATAVSAPSVGAAWPGGTGWAGRAAVVGALPLLGRVVARANGVPAWSWGRAAVVRWRRAGVPVPLGAGNVSQSENPRR